ncbi:protein STRICTOSIDINE SYNTHASE-LIKE 10-like [Panicum miliaceum]|uniref:Protein STRICTOSIDINE SYNTHASE-LIKE 10-like n=1 Tax=Panicum miliaceum TaxID=4540 RepID=A0A3L6QED1_PANMI|nr:protein STRICTOSIDINE SYNTHASE-LIKE 10-like [Panicum miliaceum]
MGIRTGAKLPLMAFLISCLAVLSLLLPCTARPVRETATIDGSRSQHLNLRGSLLRGPESVAFDGAGAGPYSGVSDGRVSKWNGQARGWSTYAYSPGYSAKACTASRIRPAELTESKCGRPLGLRFHYDSGNLYIADAYKGLMRVGPGGGEATVLATKADGVPLRFTNGVDVDQVTGEVFFTDSSMKYPRSQHERVTATGDSTGRLMKYDPKTNRVTILQSGITYPNGLAISADRTHLVVALTGPCKLMRHWIKGPKAGTSEPLADLPGYPDNVRADGKGGFWVALHREKMEVPFGPDSRLLAVRINSGGQVIQVMRGSKNVRPTEVVERDGGKLYMGSVELPYVVVVSV